MFNRPALLATLGVGAVGGILLSRNERSKVAHPSSSTVPSGSAGVPPSSVHASLSSPPSASSSSSPPSQLSSSSSSSSSSLGHSAASSSTGGLNTSSTTTVTGAARVLDGPGATPAPSLPSSSSSSLTAAPVVVSGGVVGGTPEREYSPSEVVALNLAGPDMYVTYKDGVYKITEFLPMHPGGSHVFRKEGPAIDGDWAALSFHAAGEPWEILQRYRVGKLVGGQELVFVDAYASEPPRNRPALRVYSEQPYNADPAPEALIAHPVTPDSLLYVRSHFAVPNLSPDTYTLSIQVVPGPNATFSLDSLKALPRVQVATFQMCAGQGRPQNTSGSKWETAAGNVIYGGPRVKDVVRAVAAESGYDESDLEPMHLLVTGTDSSPSGTHFNSAINWKELPDEAILAYEMNGEALSYDRGFPLRLIVPGRSGHHQVKWLEKIMVLPPSKIRVKPEFAAVLDPVSAANVSLSANQQAYLQRDESGAIYGFAGTVPVHSRILAVEEEHERASRQDGGSGSGSGSGEDADEERTPGLLVKGYAVGNAGSPIAKVELSCDGGHSWTSADVQGRSHYEWALWTGRCRPPPNPTVSLVVRAEDVGGGTQPQHARFNQRGVNMNSWHVYEYVVGGEREKESEKSKDSESRQRV